MFQGTQCEEARQDEDGQVDASLLLGLEGLAVRDVVPDGFGVRWVHLITATDAAAACPVCGVISTSAKGSATTRPRDLGYGPGPIRLVWHKRRWRCREALCARATFTECLPAVPAKARLTTRLRAECGAGIAGGFSCVSAAAGHYGIDWRIAHAAFIAHVDPSLIEPLPPVEVLGIDETRRGKLKWAQDPVTHRWVVVADRWHTGIVDAAGTAGLLGHVEGRTAALVATWLQDQPQAWRDRVSHARVRPVRLLRQGRDRCAARRGPGR